MGILLILMLLFSLTGFFTFGYFEIQVDRADAISMAINSISPDTIRLIFGVGVIFSQFGIIIFSMLDRIGDTIRDTIKPVARLMPLLFFLNATYNTFAGVAASLLPTTIVDAVGLAQSQATLAQSVESGTFTRTVLISLGTMILFLLTNRALGGPRTDPEVARLRRENARLRKELFR